MNNTYKKLFFKTLKEKAEGDNSEGRFELLSNVKHSNKFENFILLDNKTYQLNTF